MMQLLFTHTPWLLQLLAKTVSGVFHSLKTALPSFESSDSQGVGAEGQAVGSGGSGGASSNDKAKVGSGGGGGGAGAAPTEQRTKLAAFLSTTSKGEYELKLDITAEEEVSECGTSLIQTSLCVCVT